LNLISLDQSEALRPWPPSVPVDSGSRYHYIHFWEMEFAEPGRPWLVVIYSRTLGDGRETGGLRLGVGVQEDSRGQSMP